MTNHRYTIIIQWSDDDHAYVVSLPEWGEAKTHGATYEEAARNAAEVLDLLAESHDPAADGPMPAPRLFRYPGADVIDRPEGSTAMVNSHQLKETA